MLIVFSWKQHLIDGKWSWFCGHIYLFWLGAVLQLSGMMMYLKIPPKKNENIRTWDLNSAKKDCL